MIDRYATSLGVDYIERYYKIIIETASKLTNITFSIKLRNSEPVTLEIINNMIINYKLKNVSFYFENNIEWIQRMKCIVTTYSTMGLEAMIYDIPVISIESCLPITDPKDIVDWKKHNAVAVATDTYTLINAIQENLSNPLTLRKQRMKYVSATLVNQGSASESIADYIISKSNI